MGSCGSSLNCTVTDKPIESDIDIAGIGVLISFVATAIITYLAIIFGYLSDSLPNPTLTQLDLAILSRIEQLGRRIWRANNNMASLIRLSVATASAITGFGFSWSTTNSKEKTEAREHRSKALERFILALSDQQLVTGLAILIAGYTNRCTRSFYHFNIILALAWFSSTTHLSTLAVLRDYLIHRPKIREWRVLAMLSILVVLATAQLSSWSVLDSSLPVQCIFRSSQPSDSMSLSSVILVIGFLVLRYTDGIARLYSIDPDWGAQDWLVEFLRTKLGKENHLRHLTNVVIAASWRSKGKQATVLHRMKERQWLHQLLTDLESELLSLLFGIRYGITLVTVNRKNVPKAGISGSQDTMGFGQLVPLLLMALPLLAAGEIYVESQDSFAATAQTEGQTTSRLSEIPREELEVPSTLCTGIEIVSLPIARSSNLPQRIEDPSVDSSIVQIREVGRTMSIALASATDTNIHPMAE